MDAEWIRVAIEGLLIPTAWFAISVLSDLKKSIEQLNVKVAVIIERVDTHETRIVKLEEK